MLYGNPFSPHRILALGLVTLLGMLLMGCQTVTGGDLYGDCDHPAKPTERTDRAVAVYILEQSEVIEICKTLLKGY